VNGRRRDERNKEQHRREKEHAAGGDHAQEPAAMPE
jgi:hypothetical protein